MSNRATFKGYGPEQGYAFLREAIAQHDYAARGCKIEADEIFVSDGSKCDCGNIQEIFATDVLARDPDPVYPVYVDTNVMAGRTGANVDGRYQGITYLESTPANGYVPSVPGVRDGSHLSLLPEQPDRRGRDTRAQLTAWVEYAKRNKAVILFDSAYEAYIRDPEIPHSIYEIEGAREVAIEFRSFSKTAGFTGTRCAYTVVPKDAHGVRRRGQRPRGVRALESPPHDEVQRRRVSDPEGRRRDLHRRRQEADERPDQLLPGQREAHARRDDSSSGFSCIGGDNAPYIWVNTGRDSWEFFDLLLNEAQVVCTPGAGFGKCGEGHVRISAFNSRANVETALSRIAAALKA
jgi:LL-diaminopimelate aminotransferase